MQIVIKDDHPRFIKQMYKNIKNFNQTCIPFQELHTYPQKQTILSTFLSDFSHNYMISFLLLKKMSQNVSNKC